MQLREVVDVSARITATPKRTEKVLALADLLGRLEPSEIEPVIGLLVGTPRQGRMGVGWASLADVGGGGRGGGGGEGTAAALTPTLTINDVDVALSTLAATLGSGSQRSRTEQMTLLFAAATADEQRYLHRVLTGELRHGAHVGVLSDAVAKASGRSVAAVRRATMLLGDLGAAAHVALTGGDLDGVGLTPLVGVQPMLAGTASSVTEALALTGPASVEWKLDGARIQVHRRADEVRVFTRSLHEISNQVPGIVAAVRALSSASGDLVLDGEALGLDADGDPLKFQDSMNADTARRPFFFDVLHAGGTSLIDEALSTRKQVLRDSVPAELLLPTIDTTDAEAAGEFADRALRSGHEGVVVKALDSTYQAGRRGATWRKVKPVHTLDLVVLAAEWGYGRRTGWLSNLHLGARGADHDLVMVGKTFKGLTDALLRWQTETFQRLAIATDGHVVHVRPELVVEIALDGVQRSTRYSGGVALRFARVRRYREDKSAEQADTIERVRAML